jgi:Heliorhodopsin
MRYNNNMSKVISKERLRRLNFLMSGLHFVQGVILLIISKVFELPITGNYLAMNETTQRLEPVSKHLFDLSLPMLLAIFFFICALAHLVIATVYNKKYNSDLKKGINKARWIEYSLSASIMMVAISLLVGIYDLMSLVMIFVLSAVMNLMGLVMEIHNQTTEKTSWLSYWIGCISGVIPWVAIAFYMWLGADNGANAPAFVYWIFVSIFIFFNCFAINMYLQYKKIGQWKNYLYGELVYIFLSLVAKSLLAWQVFAGTLRP